MNEKILLVDDDEIQLKILCNILSEEENYSISAAKSGREAVDLLRTKPFGVVILDLLMPEMDGFEVLERIKEIDEDVQVIILTAYPSIENAIETLKDDKVIDFLVKPIELPEHLYITVKRALECRKLRLENKTLLKNLADANAALELRVEAQSAELKASHDQLRQKYEELKNTQSQLIQSAKMASVGELAAGVAHELNQPLMVIRMTAQIIRRIIQVDLNADELAKQTEFIERNTERMMNIIDHLRAFSSQYQSEISLVDVNAVMADCFLMVGEQLRISDIRVKKELMPDFPRVRGNANQLEQVFLSLITNARHAIEEKREKSGDDSQKPEQIRIVTRVSKKSSTAQILIRDTGAGISDENRGRIFDPFFSTRKIGAGLGLFVSYGIIKEHQGKIEVTETGPRGTTFRIKLPLPNSAGYDEAYVNKYRPDGICNPVRNVSASPERSGRV
ncbi:response regulator [Desulfobacterales bacterium HSG2]|nr:response regulator [Desulfobacterales bacterium HSG2]